MAHVEGIITIQVPPAKCLEALEDIPHAPEWVSGLLKVWDIEGKGKGCKYKWTFKMGASPWTARPKSWSPWRTYS